MKAGLAPAATGKGSRLIVVVPLGGRPDLAYLT